MPHSCAIVCVYRQRMVESYYASPRKVSAIHYFCAPAAGHDSGWKVLIAPIRWSGIIRNSVVCLIRQIKKVTTRCVTSFHPARLPEHFIFPSVSCFACLESRGGSATMSRVVANNPVRKNLGEPVMKRADWILNVTSFLSTNRLL